MLFIFIHTVICNLGPEIGQDEQSQNYDSDDSVGPNMIKTEPNKANKKPTPRKRRKHWDLSNNEGM